MIYELIYAAFNKILTVVFYESNEMYPIFDLLCITNWYYVSYNRQRQFAFKMFIYRNRVQSKKKSITVNWNAINFS